MKIGIIVDNDFFNDIRVKKQYDILTRLGFDIYVLCFSFNHTSYEISNNNISRIRINKKIKDTLFFVNNL